MRLFRFLRAFSCGAYLSPFVRGAVLIGCLCATGSRAEKAFEVVPDSVITGRDLGLTFGSPESFDFDLSRDEFYVADTLKKRIVVFSTRGELQGTIDLALENLSPLGIALGRQGRIYVTDKETGDLAILNYRGKVEYRLSSRELGPDRMIRLGKLRLDERGGIWGIDRNRGDVVHVTPAGFQIRLLEPEYPQGEDLKPVDLQPLVDRSVWILSSLGTVLYRFGPEQKLLGRIGRHGPSESQFSFPVAFRVGPQKTFWVIDRFRHVISVFSFQGEYLGRFGGAGTEKGQLRFPCDLYFLRDKVFAVLDSGNDRIQIFTIEAWNVSAVE